MIAYIRQLHFPYKIVEIKQNLDLLGHEADVQEFNC